jgi:uncharacterized membrane protein YeaQ/YmgE (transglycosylase-associated protein family)
MAAERSDGADSPGCCIISIEMTINLPRRRLDFVLICRRSRSRPKAEYGGRRVFHIIWYLVIGLLAGLISKSVMHMHMTLFWTVVLGIIGSVLGGGVTHIMFRPKNERYHPAGLIFSTLGAILILFICHKLNIHFPSL